MPIWAYGCQREERDAVWRLTVAALLPLVDSWGRADFKGEEGVSPAARGRAVARRVEPLSKARLRLALRAAIPHAGSPPPSALVGAQGGAGLRPRGPCRCARQCIDQGCAFIAMQITMVRPAMAAWMTTAARSRARGSRALFPSRVREQGPLDELTGVPFTPPRFVRCTPARSSPQSPPMPDAGPLNDFEVIGPVDRRVSRSPRFTWCHVGRRGAGPQRPGGRLRCNRRARQAGTSTATLRRPSAGQRVRQSSHRAPLAGVNYLVRRAGQPNCRQPLSPAAPPSVNEGGLVGGSSSGGPGNWLTASAAEEPHPSPTPSREGRGHAHPRPPVGGSEEVRAEGSVFSSPILSVPSREFACMRWLVLKIGKRVGQAPTSDSSATASRGDPC